MEERLMTPQEVAKILRVGRSFIYQILASGELPSVRVGKLYRVTPAGLALYLHQNWFHLEENETEGRSSG
jgi:excisionase family DNA binding protein